MREKMGEKKVVQRTLNVGKMIRDWFLIDGKIFWGLAAQWEIWEGGGYMGEKKKKLRSVMLNRFSGDTCDNKIKFTLTYVFHSGAL